jgi:regulatory protein
MDQEQVTQILRRAKQQAYRFLAYRNQTASELRHRLQQRGYTVTIIDEVLRQLVSDGYINDHRLALDWARYRLQAKPLGRRRMAWELQKRGIPSEFVEEVLGEVYAEFNEVALAEQAARKHLGSGTLPRSPRERQRYVRHLFNLGFDMETVTTALAALGSVDEAEEIMSGGDTC